MDLIQNANMGLKKAIDKYDNTKGVKFSTYAFYWIKNYILKNMDKDTRLITIPNYMVTIYRKVMRFIFNYEKIYGIKPTDEIIAEELELPLNKVKIARFIMNPVSLNQPYSTNEEGKEEEEYINVIPDNRDDYERVIDKMFLSQLMPLIESQHLLCDTELFIIKCRFGFDCEPMKYRQIAEILGVTHENVRQREGKALRKLGRSSIFRKYCGLDSIDDFIFNNDKSGKSLRLYYLKKGR
jgi:RNA polymerase sigma factor (sigma-70 family)